MRPGDGRMEPSRMRRNIAEVHGRPSRRGPRRWLGRDAGLPWMYGAGLLVALSLKAFYSGAGAEDLEWILGPTSRLAGWIGGIRFERETGTGWISHEHRFIVEPVCAGVNFLVVAFAAILLATAHRIVGAGARALWLPACLVGAYLWTVATNAIRIVAAVQLRTMEIYGGLVTPERVHRAVGIAVYLVSLIAVYAFVERCFERWIDPRPGRRRASLVVPVVSYLAMVLVVPLLGRTAWSRPGLFVEHAASVLTGVVTVMLGLMLLGLAAAATRRVRRKV